MDMGNACKPQRHWFANPLGWSLLLTLLLALLAIWFAVKMEYAAKQKALIVDLENLGGIVWYDYQFEANGLPSAKEDEKEPPGPLWLRRLLGDDFFINVTKLDLTPNEIGDAELTHLNDLTDLQSLSLGHTVTDAGLAHLQGLSQLHTLSLRTTQVTDTGLAYLNSLPQLQSLDLV